MYLLFRPNHYFALTGFRQNVFKQNLLWHNHLLLQLVSGIMDLDIITGVILVKCILTEYILLKSILPESSWYEQ
jgi:hypothetical protein